MPRAMEEVDGKEKVWVQEVDGNDGPGCLAQPVVNDRPECLTDLAVKDLKYFGFLDPAVGRAGSRDGDYAAIVTVGMAPDKTLYVMDVWMDKVSPMKQVAQIFALHRKFQYQKFGFEGNGFQETLGTLIYEEQNHLRRAGKHWYLPIEKHLNHHSKHSRISLMEPHIIAGSILFEQDLKQEFIVQADEYDGGGSNHDDGLDALASCVEMIRGADKSISQIKTIRRGSARWRF